MSSTEQSESSSESEKDVEMAPEPEVSDKPSRITKKIADEAICTVCYQIVKPSEVNPSDYEMVYCEECLLPAHKACIGRNLEYTLFKRPKDEVYDKMFKCDKCSDEYRDSIKCCLCQRSEGIMKKVYKVESPTSEMHLEPEFIHPCCAIYCDSYCIVDYELMKIGKTQVKIFESDKSCVYCSESKGYLIICDRFSCRVTSHLYCLFEDRKESTKASQEDEEEGWEVSFKQLISNEYMKIKKDHGIESTCCTIVSEDRNNEWKRGGYPCFKCDIHRDEPDYKFTPISNPNPQSMMISCDQCDQWFYADDIGIQLLDDQEDKPFICEQCCAWKKLKQNSLQAIIANPDKIAEYVTKDEHTLELFSRYKSCLKAIDFLYISQIWLAGYHHIKQKKLGLDVVIKHIDLADMIPMNLTLYTNDLYTMIKSKAKGKDTINLPEFEIKDIFDEDADLIEENYTYNKQLAEEMEKVLEDVEKPSPRTLVLTNRLYCIRSLEKIKDLYSSTSERKIEYAEIVDMEQELINSGYRGKIIPFLTREIEEYRIIQETFGYILSTAELKTFTEQRADRVENWKKSLCYRVSDLTLYNILQRATSLKINLTESIEKLKQMETEIKDKKTQIIDTLLCGKMKLEFHQIEDTVDELLKRTVVPTEEVYKLIDIYQVNLARDKLINGYLDEKTTRIDFDAFSKFYKEISNLADNEHLIDLKKIARLEKLHKYGSNILVELEKIGDKEMKKAKALLKEITDHKFYFERLKFFLDKLIVHHCYNTKGAEDEIYATLFYCKCLMKELSDPNKKFKDLDKKKAVRALKKKLQFTEEKLLEIKEMEDIPEMEELITQIKSNGLYTTDIHDLHERFKYCSTWFKETKTKISEDLKQKSMKDEEDEPDFVEEYYPLMVFDSSELNDYLKDVITIPELPFEKSHKLATNLRVCIWTQEYNKMNTEKKDDILDLEELTLLKDLANGFNLLPKDCEDLVKLTENYEINQIVENFKNGGSEEDLKPLVQYRNGIYVKLLGDLKPSLAQKKQKVAEKYIKYGKALNKIRDVLSRLPTPRSPTKVKSKQNDECFDRYQRLVEVLNEAEVANVPSNAYLFSYLKESLIEFENWKKSVDRFRRLKKRYEGIADKVLVSKGDYLDDEKAKSLILIPFSNLIIQESGAVVEVREAIDQVHEWLEEAEEISQKYEENEEISEIKEDEANKILEVLSKMAKLPLFSKEKKEVLHNIYCLGWMVNMQKVISEADDDKKETYQKWAEYESNIKNYTKKQFLVKSQIYTKFNTTFSEATKFQDIFNKKTKTSRVKLDEVDKVSKEMDECLVDLSQEITTLRDSVPTFKELQESLKSLEGTKPEITAYTDLLRQFRDSYFHISEEETVILKVKKAYEENKKRVKNFLIILMTKNSDRRIELSKIESLIEQYQDLKVVFAEGEKVIEEKEINHKLFKEIKKNLENSEELEYDKIIELEEKFKNMKIRFEGEEKLLKTIEKVKPRSFLNQFARWKKEKGEIVNQYSVMEAQKLYKDSDGDQNMDTEDHPALTDLEKYIEAKIDAINAFEDYIVCKEDMEKSHSNDPINYDVYYNLRLKDLKGSKLRELAKKRQVKKKEKDEEDLKKMDPEEYRRMKKRERLKRQNKNKTDVFVDKGNDEDWDARCIKYAEPDIKIEDDATEESNSQQETPKKPTAVKKNIKSSKKLILNKNSKKSEKKEPKKITKKAAAKQSEAKPAKKIVKKDLKELIKGSVKPDKKEKIDVKAKFLQKMKDSNNKNMELISKLKKAKSTQESSKTSQTKCETPSPKGSKKVTENKDDGIKEESEEESKDESEDESEDKSEEEQEEKPKKIVKKKTIPKGKQPAKPAKAASKTAKKPKKTAVKATKEDPPEKTVSSSKFGIKKGKFSLSSKVKQKAKTSILSGKKRKLGGLAASLNKINKS